MRQRSRKRVSMVWVLQLPISVGWVELTVKWTYIKLRAQGRVLLALDAASVCSTYEPFANRWPRKSIFIKYEKSKINYPGSICNIKRKEERRNKKTNADECCSKQYFHNTDENFDQIFCYGFKQLTKPFIYKTRAHL